MLRDIILSINRQAERYFENKKYSFNQFCSACEQTNIAKALGCSYSTLNKYLRELFPDRPKKATVEFWLLTQSEYKRCKCCNTIKYREDFRQNNTCSDKLNSHCIICHSKNTAKTQPHRQAKYRSSKIERTPDWTNLSKIKEIYDNCPKGYQVDHILPLQGVDICGLHVENNLQYLLPHENISKGNRMVV